MSHKTSFLGVTIDGRFSGDADFSALLGRLVGAISALVRVRHVLSTGTLLTLYHAFFASFLTYGIEASGLGYARLSDPILKLQKRAIRVVSRRGPRDHTRPLFIFLDVHSFIVVYSHCACKMIFLDVLPYHSLVKFGVCLLIYNILNFLAPRVADLKNSNAATRGGSNKLSIPHRCSANISIFSIIAERAIVCNALPESVRAHRGSQRSFKRVLIAHLFTCDSQSIVPLV